MRIATWNVNSVRLRLGHLIDFLKEAEPDALCLQELKCTDADFPRAEVEAAGWQVATHGQKTFNGVAIISRRPLEDVRRGLPGDAGDEQSRYIEGVLPLGFSYSAPASANAFASADAAETRIVTGPPGLASSFFDEQPASDSTRQSNAPRMKPRVRGITTPWNVE